MKPEPASYVSARQDRTGAWRVVVFINGKVAHSLHLPRGERSQPKNKQ